MENGECIVENGEWRMESGSREWRIENRDLPIQGGFGGFDDGNQEPNDFVAGFMKREELGVAYICCVS